MGKAPQGAPGGVRGGVPSARFLLVRYPKQGVQQPRPMPNAMGQRPIADGAARATRCTPDGHREHATSPLKQRDPHPTPSLISSPTALHLRRHCLRPPSTGRPLSTSSTSHIRLQDRAYSRSPMCGLQHDFFAALRASWRAAQQIIIVVHASRKSGSRVIAA